MKTLQLKAYAKINLVLNVIKRLPDGYHALRTVFQEIDLYDEIGIREQENKITLITIGIRIPGPRSKNLVLRAALLLKEKSGLSAAGAEIILNKKVPPGTGLGAGSSDAACVLKALNRLWRLNWPLKKLESIGRVLGADVAFFLRGGTALGTGHGDKLQRLPSLRKQWLVLAWPGFGVSTALVYRGLRPELLKVKPHVKMLCGVLKSKSPAEIHSSLCNDLETVVFREFPRIEKIKRKLIEAGAEAALMSGSGSVVFGLAKNRQQADRVARKIRPYVKRVWVTHTR